MGNETGLSGSMDPYLVPQGEPVVAVSQFALRGRREAQVLDGAEEMASRRSATDSSGRFLAMSAWLTMPTRS